MVICTKSQTMRSRQTVVSSSYIIAFFFLSIPASIVIALSFSSSSSQDGKSSSPSFITVRRPADAFRVASYQCRRQRLVEPSFLINNDNKNEPMLALERVAEVLREASAHSVDLVIFPEMFFSFASGGIGDHSSAVESDKYELNIVGDLCAELGVACVLPYMERAVKNKKGKSSEDEKNPTKNSPADIDKESNDGDKIATSELEFYSAAQVWSSDGTMAGNIRAIIPPSPPPPKGNTKSKPKFLSSGHPSRDMEPLTITLDNSEMPQIKCGIIIGFNDIERPEQARHLARKGVDLLIVPSLGGKTLEKIYEGLTVANHVIPTRAMENSVFVAYAAYEGDEEMFGEENSNFGRNIQAIRSSYVGSSSVVAPDGSFLAKGPTCFGGALPQTDGFVLSLGGDESSAAALYAADISLNDSTFVQRRTMNNPCEDGSLDLWEMEPQADSSVIRGVMKKNGSMGSSELKKDLDSHSVSPSSSQMSGNEKETNIGRRISSDSSTNDITGTSMNSNSRATGEVGKHEMGLDSPSPPSPSPEQWQNNNKNDETSK